MHMHMHMHTRACMCVCNVHVLALGMRVSGAACGDRGVELRGGHIELPAKSALRAKQQRTRAVPSHSV